jgi:hypothetical protein
MRRVAGIFFLTVVTACGGSAAEGRPLPTYTGHAVDLFDDGIEPTAVGYPPGASPPPASDPSLRERTQTGDAVVRARVMTVTAKVEDTGRSWQIGMRTLGRLGGSGPLDQDFTLSVGGHDQAAGIVGAFESRLVGRAFIVFVREFGRDGAPKGERGDLRFHVAADAPEEQKAVSAAVSAH